MGLEYVIAFIVTKFINLLTSKGEEYLTQKGMDRVWDFFVNNKKTFSTELTNVINETILAYAKSYPILEENSKIPFYTSQTFLNELLEFSFFRKIDIEKIKQAIEQDGRIIIPSEKEITDFLDILKVKIEKTKSLKSLFYQKTIVRKFLISLARFPTLSPI